MKFRRLSFGDLKEMGVDLVGCWVQHHKFEAGFKQAKNDMYLISSIASTGGILFAQHFGLRTYDPESDVWKYKSRKMALDILHNRACEEQYSGPIQWDSGEIVWFYGDILKPLSGHKIYPKTDDKTEPDELFGNIDRNRLERIFKVKI